MHYFSFQPGVFSNSVTAQSKEKEGETFFVDFHSPGVSPSSHLSRKQPGVTQAPYQGYILTKT